jgi:hypothetical protein
MALAKSWCQGYWSIWQSCVQPCKIGQGHMEPYNKHFFVLSIFFSGFILILLAAHVYICCTPWVLKKSELQFMLPKSLSSSDETQVHDLILLKCFVFLRWHKTFFLCSSMHELCSWSCTLILGLFSNCI